MFKGDFGQYFTPREIIQFTVEMLRPQADDMTLDPACGSGGFLLYAMDYVRHAAEKLYDDDETARFRHWHEYAERRLFGIEINDEISRVAKMNMILHDDGHTNVVSFDALEKLHSLKEQNLKIKQEAFDLILTNPPFGAMSKEAEKGKAYMEGWELLNYVGKSGGIGDDGTGLTDFKAGKKGLKSRTSIKTEILFCERIYQLLKPGTGRAAVVLPDTILTNSSLQGVRTWLVSKFRVKAVISLPQFAFQHSGAAVKASVVFLEKRALGATPSDDEPIFMAAPENIGYGPTGHKTFEERDAKVDGRRKTAVWSCDLFDMGVLLDWDDAAKSGRGDWTLTSWVVWPETGILGRYRAFEKDSRRFFV